MHIYKVMQRRSTGEYLMYLVRRKPMHSADAEFMHYRIVEYWHTETMGE